MRTFEKIFNTMLNPVIIFLTLMTILAVTIAGKLFTGNYVNKWAEGCDCGGRYKIIAVEERNGYCLCECENCGNVEKIREYDIIHS